LIVRDVTVDKTCPQTLSIQLEPEIQVHNKSTMFKTAAACSDAFHVDRNLTTIGHCLTRRFLKLHVLQQF